MAIANTRVTVLRGVARDLFGDFADLPTEAGTDAQTNVPAALNEITRTITTPSDPTPRVVRYVIARLPAGTDITEEDRLRDERTGRIYIVSAVTPADGVGTHPDLRVDLQRTN